MPLLDLKTNLKSLKFGFDLPEGGSSNQPFVEKPIPSDEESTPGSSPDFILRQGTLRRIVDDETRFFKYFTSTPGLAFIGKQNLLSLTSVQTQASKLPPNQGVYLPTSTLAQLAANPFGGHLNFLGADPTGLIGGIRKYGDLVKPSINLGQTLGLDPSSFLGRASSTVSNILAESATALGFEGDIVNNNRLVNLSKDLGLTDKKAEPQTGLGGALQSARNFLSGGKTILYSYPGGPGAAEGIGKTNIYRYSNTGFDNPLYTNNPNYFFWKRVYIPCSPIKFWNR